MADVSLTSWLIFKAGGIDTDKESATWKFSTPTVGNTISWDSGSNTVDSAVVAARPTITETKFLFPIPPALPGPLAKPLGGMRYLDTGIAGTTAITTGTGKSYPLPGTLYGTNWRCDWDLKINVTPGTPRGNVNYKIYAEADDPISFKSSDFDNNSHGLTSFYLPVAMENLSYQNGGGGMKMSYKTAVGTVELLDLSSSAASGVVVSGDAPDFLSFYLVNEPLENPMTSGIRPYSLAELKDVFSARMRGTLQSSPIILGILLENVALPTGAIGPDDLVAEFHIASHLHEIGQGDEDGREEQEQRRER